MFEKITDWLIERRLRREHIDVNPKNTDETNSFIRVLNTLRRNKVVVVTKDDGIYVRLAGDESTGEAFSLEFAKVLSLNTKEENKK